jgi:hypothetical protein
MAEDANVANDGHGFGGIALAHNTRTREEVDAVLPKQPRPAPKSSSLLGTLPGAATPAPSPIPTPTPGR